MFGIHHWSLSENKKVQQTSQLFLGEKGHQTAACSEHMLTNIPFLKKKITIKKFRILLTLITPRSITRARITATG